MCHYPIKIYKNLFIYLNIGSIVSRKKKDHALFVDYKALRGIMSFIILYIYELLGNRLPKSSYFLAINCLYFFT